MLNTARRKRTADPYAKYSVAEDLGIITAFFRLFSIEIIPNQKIIQIVHMHMSPKTFAMLEISILYGRFQAVQNIDIINIIKLTAHIAAGTLSRSTRVMEREYFLRIEKK